MALITTNKALNVYKKKKPRRGSLQKVYNQITNLNEYQLIEDNKNEKRLKGLVLQSLYFDESTYHSVILEDVLAFQGDTVLSF